MSRKLIKRPNGISSAPKKAATRKGSSFARLMQGVRDLLSSRRSKRPMAPTALEDHRDIVLARDALAEIKREGSVPWEEVKASLGL